VFFNAVFFVNEQKCQLFLEKQLIEMISDACHDVIVPMS